MNLQELTINQYLSKEEIKAKLGPDYNDELWLEVKQYRKRFASVTNLTFIGDKLCFVSLTPQLVKDYIELEKLFMELDKVSFMYETINNKSHMDVLVDVKLKEYKDIINAHGYQIKEVILEDIFLNKPFNVTENEQFAFNLCKMFEKLSEKNKLFNYDNLETIYSSFNEYGFLRTRNVTNNGVHVGIDKTIINSTFENLINFVKENELPVIIKSIVTNFYYRNAIFNEKYNDLMAFAAMNLVLSEKGYEQYMNSINFMGVALKDLQLLDSAYKNCINSNGDLTYYVFFMIKSLKKAVENSIKVITGELGDVDNSINSEKKLRNMANKLLHDNINIKKKQAWFLVNHDNEGTFYSIDDYKKFNSSSYETSRYSMDNLAKYGYYEKQKTGKKYVYVRTDKKIV